MDKENLDPMTGMQQGQVGPPSPAKKKRPRERAPLQDITGTTVSMPISEEGGSFVIASDFEEQQYSSAMESTDIEAEPNSKVPPKKKHGASADKKRGGGLKNSNSSGGGKVRASSKGAASGKAKGVLSNTFLGNSMKPLR